MAAIKEEGNQLIDMQSQQSPHQPDQTQDSTSAVAPVKPDKPRPHVCGTCGRSFARLEHLKRHERSHTKEKPFECPQCTRCFARRDLLLRHQQKLHQAGAPSSRLKQGRRGSMSVASATGKGRKNSMIGDFADVQAKPGVNGHRPRANTISHIGQPPPAFMMGPGLMRAHSGLHSHHASLSGFIHPDGNDGLWPSNRNPNLQLHGLPHLNTHHMGFNFTDAMQASPMADSASSLNMGQFQSLGGSTIDPTQLHFDAALGTPGPILEAFGPFSSAIEDDENFHWTGGLGESLLGVNDTQHLDGASPSAISTDSHAVSDALHDNPSTVSQSRINAWPTTSAMAPPPLVSTQAFVVDPITAALYPELIAHQDTISPQVLQGNPAHAGYNVTATMPYAQQDQYENLSHSNNEYLAHVPMSFEQQNAENTFHSLNWPPSHTPLMEAKFCSVTESTRHVLMSSLAQPSGFGHTSRRSISSPTGSLPHPNSPGLFPSTAELQRFVNAYVHYFHPHLPFLHLPTLNFNQLVNINAHRGRTPYGGCLILAMAAIGASYEYEPIAGKELFEAAKKLIGFYLEERRNMSALGSSPSSHRTPLWLVQAMLLNLIFGHCCGDKVAADIATTHCAALVGLAKAANLESADPDIEAEVHQLQRHFVTQSANVISSDAKPLSSTDTAELGGWIRWKSREERKRTLFAVFALSSLLVSAYNHQPRILNSELNLDLPCEEDLWAAESFHAWTALGGAESAASTAVSFEHALTFLLTANQRRHGNTTNGVPKVAASRTALSSHEPSSSELRPSTFGAYVLIYALHVYIWETRQRHHGRRWKAQELEQMHASVAPALQAWQAAWSSNPRHRLDWPNPHGPLPADCVPLLDLAYVRLFVNLSRCKEAFWQRDFTAMANGLRQSPEYMPMNSRDASPDLSYGSASVGTSASSPASGMDLMNNDMLVDIPDSKVSGMSHRARSEQSLHRERYLRKAAFYAADSLSMADTLGTAFLEFSTRELPIQAAICQFDCAQVLAEWLVTVQERVGLYLGVLGRDRIESIQSSAIAMLEDEDIKLLQKVQTILDGASLKTQQHNGDKPWEQQGNGSLGGRLLRLTAYRLHRAAIWQVTNVMAQALIVSADVADQRAAASLSP